VYVPSAFDPGHRFDANIGVNLCVTSTVIHRAAALSVAQLES
jgi:hypothetical protein